MLFEEQMRGMSAVHLSRLLTKEIDDLGHGRAPVQRVSAGILAREECLALLRKLEEDFVTGAPQALADASSALHSLRMLSINVVECVVRWRGQLLYMHALTHPEGNRSPAAITFLWRGENYLARMKNDARFLV